MLQENIIMQDKQKMFSLLNNINEINIQLAKQHQLTYAKMYHFLRGNLINFKQYPYLQGIYEDKSKEIVIQKSAQCGVSEYLINLSFFLTENYRMNGLYCFPAQSQLNAFSHGRVEPVIDQSPHLKELEGDTNNVSLRKIANGFIYFRGMQEMKQIVSVDADYLFLDEMDLMKQDLIPVVEKRLGGSEHKIKRFISTPSWTSYGVNGKFKEGDMREWFIKCEHCNHWQYLNFFKNVDIKNKIYICKKCKRKINTLTPGKWVARHPDRKLHSYHISKMFSIRSSAKELIKDFNNKAATKHFYNFDLGLPYISQGSRLTEEHLKAIVNKSNYEIKYNGHKTCMGVDVGVSINHIYITENNKGIPKTLFAGTVKDFDDIKRYMNIYNVAMCVIDGQPETRESKKLAKKFPGRVFLAWYPPMKNDLYYKKDKREGINIVNINRTLSLDYMLDDFFMQKIELPKNIEIVDDFLEQMTSLVRVKETNKNGNIVARYIEEGADHFAHARNYCRVAEAIFDKMSDGVWGGILSTTKNRIFSGGSQRVMP
jgi:hypothetical protein